LFDVLRLHCRQYSVILNFSFVPDIDLFSDPIVSNPDLPIHATERPLRTPPYAQRPPNSRLGL
jgi:hypothetical protein